MLGSLMIIFIAWYPANNVQQPEDEHAFAYLQDQFSSPDKQYGSAPLWVWNTQVTEKIIDDMMQDFKDNAFGGVFIHPRPGLVIEYLSPEWFALCDYTLKKGKELGLDVWIYDENSYPSGFAGGHVPAQMPESYNQGQMLHLTKANILPDSAAQFFIILKKEEQGFKDITRQLSQEKGKEGNYYLFSKAFYSSSPWYGGFSYVDLMVEGVTEKFIEVTMEGYERVMGDAFGKAVPGVFTDEPNIEVQGKGNIRWTPDLFENFQQKWGYDLQLHLPSLFEEVGDWKKVRHNYYQTLLQLFIDRWSKPWHAYTEQKGLEWTGHYWEHGWPNPNHGGDNMAMYAWHQRPAIDMLFNQFNEESPNAQFGNIRAVKELSSVANQLGKERTLSETYGGGGWELTFEDMKRLGDWEYVLGVNTLNQHLSFMTIMGARKYDYPPSFSYHSPWWPYYKPLNEYFARLSLALSRGQQKNDMLVLEPTTSAWMYAGYQQSHPHMQEIGQAFQSFVTSLEKAQVEYDLGSENIIKDHGKVADSTFVIGERAYHTVVIPPGMENIDGITFALLQEYMKNGGKILKFEEVQRVDGKEDQRLQEIFGSNIELSQLNEQLINQHFASDEIRFPGLDTAGGNLYHHRRQLTDGQLLFLANVSLEEPSQGKVQIKGKDALLLDLTSGEIMNYPEQHHGEEITLDYELAPAGSILFFISPQRMSDLPDYEPIEVPGEKIQAGTTDIKRLHPNVLTIDFCDVQLGGTLLEDLHVYDAADTVFRHYGFENGNPWNTSVQFRKNTVGRDTFPAGTGFIAIYYFDIQPGVNRDSLKVVVERPALWRVLVNGQEIQPLAGKWWLDKTFAVFDMGEATVQGKNQLELIANPMRVHAEIEPVYILGDFNLKPADQGWAIVNSDSLTLGSWKEQGLPLYGHEVAYRKKLKPDTDHSQYWIKLGDWKGTVAVVNVNDEQVGILSHPPYVQDISAYIQEGENTVEVVVVGSLKNTLGPFHNDPEPGLVSPWHFRNVGAYPPGTAYQLYDYGLIEDFEIFSADENSPAVQSK